MKIINNWSIVDGIGIYVSPQAINYHIYLIGSIEGVNTQTSYIKKLILYDNKIETLNSVYELGQKSENYSRFLSEEDLSITDAYPNSDLIDLFIKNELKLGTLKGCLKTGWYDWFCEPEKIPSKTKKLLRLLYEIRNTKKFDISNTAVMFKNNCHVDYGLYDDFRILDLYKQSSNPIFTIIPYYPHIKQSAVYGPENKFEEPLVSGTWNDVLRFFNKE